MITIISFGLIGIVSVGVAGYALKAAIKDNWGRPTEEW